MTGAPRGPPLTLQVGEGDDDDDHDHDDDDDDDDDGDGDGDDDDDDDHHHHDDDDWGRPPQAPSKQVEGAIEGPAESYYQFPGFESSKLSRKQRFYQYSIFINLAIREFKGS